MEVPDNDGTNYASWDKALPKSQRRRIADVVRTLPDGLLRREEYGPNWLPGGWEQLANRIENRQFAAQEIEAAIWDASFDAKLASDVLRKAGFVGIVYPAEYRSGGRSDGAKNYVIFDEADAKIVGKTRFFRTPEGEAYGFVKDGKIYIDPRVALAESRVHEYSHLWAEGLRHANPEAWERLKAEMLKDKALNEYVKKLYPELEGDGLVEEVFAHFSGKRGAERLRAEYERMSAEAREREGLTGVARVKAMFDKLRKLLSGFWQRSRDLFAGKREGIEELTGEEFADMALGDLLGGFDPRGARAEKDGNYGSDRNDRNDGELGEREVRNVVVKSEDLPLPRNMKEAVEAVKRMERPFINDDQGKEIVVASNAVKHSSIQDHDGTDARCMGIIDRIIKNAVKIGNLPIDADEAGHTHAVEVYYCPVNIDGVQYSARMVVKQYENRGMVLEDFRLYDLTAKKGKTDASTVVRGASALAPTSASVSSYKVKELVHSTQEGDRKLLGLGAGVGLRFERGGGLPWMPAWQRGAAERRVARGRLALW